MVHRPTPRPEPPVHILGTAQSDFAAHLSRTGGDLFSLMRDVSFAALDDAGVEPEEIEAAHVGCFTGELFAAQGHLGGFFASMHPGFVGVPAARHEAACASGSVAVLAATSALAAGRADVALVVGIEQMRNVPGDQAAEHLGVAAFHGREAEEARYVWPHLFAELADFYAERYGLDHEHLFAWSKQMFENGKQNPLAQTRGWSFGQESFTADDNANPVVEGRLRRHDCGQITDGAAAVVLCSDAFMARKGLPQTGPRIVGHGHTTAPMSLQEKLPPPGHEGVPFPHVRRAIEQAWARAGCGGVTDIDVIELHDCFSITGYMLVDHLGLASPGSAGEVIAAGRVAPEGELPINPSGGLIGLGHPVGATGVRMLRDVALQVSGCAPGLQIEGARRAQTINIGGSATTAVSFVVQGEPV